MNRPQSVGDFFGKKWHLYQTAIRREVLCHTEMLSALSSVLADQFGDRTFSFADFGCGDGTAVLQTLKKCGVSSYVGVDAAPQLIDKARENLEILHCEKRLICGDMADAIDSLNAPVDVIYCAYSLHHLLPVEKERFVAKCAERLTPGGCLLIVDGFLSENESRDSWLARLEQRFVDKVPEFTAEDRAQLMQHPRDSDVPQTISDFRRMGQPPRWRSFEVLVHRDDFLAFLLFEK